MSERDLDTRESVRVVTANNFLKASGLEDITLKARKLLYLAIAQCRKTDKQFYEYSISVTEFATLMNIDESNVYKEADSLTDELMQGFMKFTEPGKKRFLKFVIFEKCEYDEGKINFKLSREMSPLLWNLKKDFTQPLLNDFIRMRSNYSMEIWHVMQREMRSKKTSVTDIVEFELSLEELRFITGTTDKFKQIGQFKSKVLDKALREIKDNCGVVIDYTNLKTGRTITGFRFFARSLYHIDEAEIPQHVKRHVEAGKMRIAAEQQKRGIRSVPESEELPLTEPQHQHHRPLTQMEKEQYSQQTKNAEQLDIFSFLDRQ